MSGDKSNEATPVPIPNTEVKLICADGTADCCGRVGRCQAFLFITSGAFARQKHTLNDELRSNFVNLSQVAVLLKLFSLYNHLTNLMITQVA